MSARRVLLVNFYYPPDGTVGSQITAKFSKYLPDAGWDAWVLTGAERYYEGVDTSRLADVRRPDRVRRTACLPHPRRALALARGRGRVGGRDPEPAVGSSRRASWRRTIVRHVVALLGVPDDLTGWIPLATAAGLHMHRRERFHALVSSGPPWTNHLVAAALARLTRLPWVACFEDPWIEFKAGVMADRTSALSLAIERRVERSVIRRADAIVCLNDVHRRALLGRFADLDPAKFVTITNGFDAEDFAAAAPLPSPPADRFVVSYTGSIVARRTPRHFFAAVRRVLDAGVIPARDLTIDFVGWVDVSESRPTLAMIAEHGLEGVVRLAPTAPRAEAIRTMCASHLLLVLAHDWVLQIPAKTYQYLRAGRPILALAPEGATAEFVRASGAGVVVDPYDVPGIADALTQHILRFRAGAPVPGAEAGIIERFDQRRLAASLANLLSALTAAPAPIRVSATVEDHHDLGTRLAAD